MRRPLVIVLVVAALAGSVLVVGQQRGRARMPVASTPTASALPVLGRRSGGPEPSLQTSVGITMTIVTPSLRRFTAVAATNSRYVFDFGDGSPVVDSPSGSVEHAFPYGHGTNGLNHYEVTATAYDKDEPVGLDTVTVEFADDVGIERSLGHELIETRPCVLSYSVQVDRWVCTTMVRNLSDVAMKPQKLVATFAQDGQRSYQEMLAQTLELPAHPAFPEVLEPGQVYEASFEIPGNRVTDATTSVMFSLSATMEGKGRMATAAISSTFGSKETWMSDQVRARSK